MPLILAVEPDSRQASRLAVVLRGRRHTEVVVSKSAGAGIDAMAGRVPDVLLTSQLLSPQDEARLAEWLKELGAAAAHVHALTIPILAVKTQQEEPQRGLLAGLRRRPQQTGPHGCEPKVFADHVAAYLEQGLVERAEGVVPEITAASPVAAPPVEAPSPIEATTPLEAEWAIEAEWPLEAVAEIETVAEPDAVDPVESLTEVEPVMEVVAPDVYPDPMLEPEPEPVPLVAVAETVVTEVFTGHAATSYVAAADAGDDEGLWLLTRSPQVIEFNDEPAGDEPSTLPLGGRSPAAEPPQVLTLPRNVVPIAPMEVVFVPPEVITIRDDAYDTTGLRRTGAAASGAASSMVPLEASADAAPPIQDEWGFFDPTKCGFAALLNKLDEITDDDKPADREVESSVRIVTHY